MSRHAAYIPGLHNANIMALMNGQPDFVEVTTGAASGDEVEVTHGLGRVPRGFAVVRATADVPVYDSGTEWTTTRLFIKSTATDAAITLAVF